MLEQENQTRDKLARAFAFLEEDEFAAEVLIASSPRMLSLIILEHWTSKEIVSNLNKGGFIALGILEYIEFRIPTLLYEKFDTNFDNPRDTAIAAFLLVLESASKGKNSTLILVYSGALKTLAKIVYESEPSYLHNSKSIAARILDDLDG